MIPMLMCQKIHTVMHAMMAGSVENIFQRSKLRNGFRVQPKHVKFS